MSAAGDTTLRAGMDEPPPRDTGTNDTGIRAAGIRAAAFRDTAFRDTGFGDTGVRDTPWRDRAGAPIACVEKLRVLRENARDVRQTLRDVFDDAVLMGVDPDAMRAMLRDMVAGLKGPGA